MLVFRDGRNLVYLLVVDFLCLTVGLLMEKYTLLPRSIWETKKW